MSGLKQILQETTEHRLNAGGAVSASVIGALRNYRTRQFATFVVLFAAIICAVAFCAYFVMKNPSQVSHIRVIAGFMGLGTGGGIEVLRRLWKEWSQTELLLILVEDASESQITTLVDKLIKKL